MQYIRSLWFVIIVGAFVALSACQSAGPTARTDSNSTVAEQRATPAYTLGTGDKLRITVYGHPDLSGEFEVDGTGSISLPLIGQVEALGLTTPQLEAKIVSLLDGDYLLNPRVSAEVANYRPFYILGEVGRPGEYPYTSGLTVLNAVAAAGGFSYRADRRVVFIKSADGTSEVKYKLDSNTLVQPGDTLRIKERLF